MSEINLDIPAELISGNSHEIRYELLDGKIVIGLCGYAGSGKDSLAVPMVERLGFKRIAFADMLKIDMNTHMKNIIYEDLISKNVKISLEEVDFLNPKNREIKEILRPYIIWFGEQMREINGRYCWINKAFLSIGDSKKVVITDVRRDKELEIFEENREYLNRIINNRHELDLPDNPIDDFKYTKRYESLLIYVNQRGLEDSDVLTLDTITAANKKWLFDYTVYVDSKIPNDNDGHYRNKHMRNHLLKLVEKFPQYFV